VELPEKARDRSSLVTPEATFAVFFSAMKIIMEEKEMTITELAKRSEISRETIHKYIGGSYHTPTLENLASLAGALGRKLTITLERLEETK